MPVLLKLIYNFKAIMIKIPETFFISRLKGETDHQPRLDAWNKCSGLVHWEDPEGSGGEGGGREDRDGEYM